MSIEENQPFTAPEIKGRRIAEDKHGNVCLTDLWELADGPENLTPSR